MERDVKKLQIKIQSAEQLKKKRNWPGEVECKLCGQLESTDHIIFCCVIAQFVWCVRRDVLEWSSVPVTANDFQERVIEESNKQIMNLIFLFGCVARRLWLIRNNLAFNNVVISSPDVGLYRVISFMQKWKILSKEKGQQWIEAMIQRLNTNCHR